MSAVILCLIDDFVGIIMSTFILERESNKRLMRVTAQTKAATRQRILDTARRLFTDRGYDATATRDIARAAGIASGTLFNYFPTKEAIVACLAREAITRS